ncbi:hypothetical protein H9Y04_19910 [Streptomyces sp. TRM66268-LWL]|uniref:Uncharacterized protein n=1 Tax=Streptomyces polyasparticus TaxID=2767826 RepID=A0ABR7SJQ6_9ACTN|nr:hypothetical protein [Streptomyces polyasparticus]MBC9714822.1 hypothetical protein [Streptomyces polyasparticus]
MEIFSPDRIPVPAGSRAEMVEALLRRADLLRQLLRLRGDERGALADRDG